MIRFSRHQIFGAVILLAFILLLAVARLIIR